MPNLKSYKQQLTLNHHRGMVVISGEWDYCIAQLATNQPNPNNSWWLGDHAISGYQAISNKQAQQLLGQECQTLVINAHNGIDLNALGAVTGCLTAGGLCYLLTPELTKWPQQHDPQRNRFDAYNSQNSKQTTNYTVQHISNKISKNSRLVMISREQTQIPRLEHAPYHNTAEMPYKTTEQQQAVEKILKVVNGHRNRPLVLTADRGRGKSSALGIAAAKLITAGKTKIIITAPNIDCVEPVFIRAKALNKTITDQLEFIALDQLIATKPAADLMMIDEAAAIPAPQLTELLSSYSRIVFTSTISGYEGTGRGFEIRFKAKLNQLTPNWRAFHILEPIRFAADDILENFVNQALMLEAKSANISQSPPNLTLTHWSSKQLIAQPDSLSQLFALLTLAHYKTSPNDLRHLLDGNNIEVYSLGNKNDIIGVALIAIEGKINDELAAAINQGRRRVKGHLIPQSLNFHCGFANATSYQYARVIRIAIHPDIQQQNLGSQFLTVLEQHYQTQQIDFIGASFGANKALIDFWQKNQYQPVRLGHTIEASSNEYSVIVLKALNKQAPLKDYQQRFHQQLPQQLIECNQKLSSQIIVQLFSGMNNSSTDNNIKRWMEPNLNNYIYHQLDYEYCMPELYQWLMNAIANHSAAIQALLPQQQSLLINKIIRKQSWQQICKTLNISGKKQAAKQLKTIIAKLY